jgi:protein tyrosine/serine phosphatase
VDRWYALEGCDNVRDLGGLPTADGGRTRTGVLLRCGTPQQATPADVTWLRDDFGLRTVLDLRATEEAAREGRGLLGQQPIAYHNVSFLVTKWVFPDDPGHVVLVRNRSSSDRVDHYLNYLRLAGDSVAAAVQLVCDADNGPTLFHCAAGKDRTGVLAALVLTMVGVDRDTIIADYVATNEHIDAIEERLSQLPSYSNGIRTRAETDQLRVRPEVMSGFLDGVEEIWGGALGWARQSGIPEASLEGLHQRLVATSA